MRRLGCLAGALAVLAASTAGCAPSAGTGGGPITVLAAASLSDPFSEIARRFEAAHRGNRVTLSFDASSALVRQVAAGAPADVVATADEAALAEVVGARLVGAPVVFARNRLAIVVAGGNPHGVRAVADLARPEVVVVLCAPEVPCGRFAAQVLDRAEARVRPRSYEPNVKAVVTKVALGEADAGVVYRTDVGGHNALGNIESVAIPPEHNVVASYAIATVSSSKRRGPASAFVDYVRSAEAQAVLAQRGFEPA